MTAPPHLPDLAVVIVSWNTRDLLARCLDTVRPEIALDSARADHSGDREALVAEVLVVDNDSTDNTIEMVRAHFPWVGAIANRENVGFARAANQGIRGTRSRFVLLLNPDTRLCAGALPALVRAMGSQAGAGIVGACLVGPDGTPLVSGESAPTLARELRRLFHLGSSGTRPKASTALQPVDTVPGTCMLLRRSMLDVIGLLDEGYFMYSEDTDLCRRARRAGWAVYWTPTAQVVHLGGQSTRQVATAMFLQLYESKVRYVRKHHGRSAARLYKLILAGAALARLAISPAAWLEPRDQRREHRQLAGRYRGLLRALPRL